MLQGIEIHYDGLPPELLIEKAVARLDLEHVKDPDLGKILASDIETGINLGWRWPMRVEKIAEACQKLPFINKPLSPKSILDRLNNNKVLSNTAWWRLETQGRPRVYCGGAFFTLSAFLHTRDEMYNSEGDNYNQLPVWLRETRERLGEGHLLTGYLIKPTDSITSREETADEEIKRALRSVTVVQLQDWAAALGKSPGTSFEVVSIARLARDGIEMPYAVLNELCKLPGNLKRLDNPAAVIQDSETSAMFALGVTLACRLLDIFPGVDFYQLTDAIKENKGRGQLSLRRFLKAQKLT